MNAPRYSICSRRVVLAALAISCVPALGGPDPEARTPLEAYRAQVAFARLKCQITFRLNQAQAEGGRESTEDGNYRKCIADGLRDGRAAYDAALKTVRKKAAIEALKSFHVAFVAALQGIEPGGSEPRFAYAQRQEMLGAKVNEAWARFDLER